MGKIKPHYPVKLIAAITTTDPSASSGTVLSASSGTVLSASSGTALWQKCKLQLEAQYSQIDMQMDWFNFHHTTYYIDEMGQTLKKCIVTFDRLIDAADLPEIKIATNILEQEFLSNGKRQINIDPGYVSTPKLVLASTKDYSHRLYLGKGIFGDIHLKYQDKKYRAQPWTYPDYQEPFVIDFLAKVRQKYKIQLGEFLAEASGVL